MKLRIAKKILKAVGTPDESRYTDFQIGKANDRYKKTASAKAETAFFLSIVRRMSVSERVRKYGRRFPGLAFQVLMESDDWNSRRPLQ